MKRYFSTAFLFMIMAVLLYFIFFKTNNNNKQFIFSDLSSLASFSLVLENSQHVNFIKKKTGWIVNDLGDADENHISALLSVMRSLKKERSLNSVSLKSSGISDSKKILICNNKKMYIGNITSEKKFAYASFDMNRIFLIPAKITELFFNNAQEYLSRIIFPDSIDDITSVSITYPNKKKFVFEKEDLQWYIREPVQYNCDPSIMKMFLQQLISIKYTEIISAPSDSVSSKKQKDYYNIAITYNKETVTLTVAILKNNMFLSYDSHNRTGWIDAAFEHKLLYDAHDFRPKRVFSLTFKTFTQATIVHNNAVKLSITDKNKQQYPFLYDLLNLTFDKLVGEFDNATFGFNNPVYEVMFSSPDQSESLLVGKKYNQYYYCTDKKSVFLIQSVFIDHLIDQAK